MRSDIYSNLFPLFYCKDIESNKILLLQQQQRKKKEVGELCRKNTRVKRGRNGIFSIVPRAATHTHTHTDSVYSFFLLLLLFSYPRGRELSFPFSAHAGLFIIIIIIIIIPFSFVVPLFYSAARVAIVSLLLNRACIFPYTTHQQSVVSFFFFSSSSSFVTNTNMCRRWQHYGIIETSFWSLSTYRTVSFHSDTTFQSDCSPPDNNTNMLCKTEQNCYRTSQSQQSLDCLLSNKFH